MQTGSWNGAGQAALEGAIDGAVDGFLAGSAAAVIGAGAGALGRVKSSGGCFIAGTAVATVLGTKAIEEIQVGDLVWSYNEETKENELKEVTRLYRYDKTELIRVHTSDGQTISATTEHPFYVVNEQNWFAAKDLRAGDILLLVNGKTVIVEYIQHELLENTKKVYNFEVANNHNYYVAESVFANAEQFVLVHNVCNGNVKTISNEITGKQRIGSALKTDPHHAFPDIIDNYVGYASKTPINNGAIKFELTGSLNGKEGTFQWMINSGGKIFHRYFKVK